MNYHKIFDNGGKTIDRYTLLTEPFHFGKSCNAFGFSDDPLSPQGFNQFCGDVFDGADIGKEISFDDLPDDVQTAVLNRLENNE